MHHTTPEETCRLRAHIRIHIAQALARLPHDIQLEEQRDDLLRGTVIRHNVGQGTACELALAGIVAFDLRDAKGILLRLDVEERRGFVTWICKSGEATL